ncbi:unnamed protein product [Cercopithifilaria johnstoni]|uniref:C-type lectin domain-containing protein n=1 Tax=Cercopithifilaria johnstoni TaxID=2874296 RepID=A0A8J2MBY0_9BILA|nr:unnamed protein product [Cercopithifilaria johnstoni]
MTTSDEPYETTSDAPYETISQTLQVTTSEATSQTPEVTTSETTSQTPEVATSETTSQTPEVTTSETTSQTPELTTSETTSQTLEMTTSETTSQTLEMTTSEVLYETTSEESKVASVDAVNKGCTNDSQCSPQQLCAVDGYCVLDPSFPKFGPRCHTSADCKKSGVCQKGRCHISYPFTMCKINEQCTIDEICVMGGYCVPDPHSRQHGIGMHELLNVHGRFTFKEGFDYCVKVNANLVTIRDPQQANYVNYIYIAGGDGSFWIGLLKDIKGNFKWQSGESVNYTNWNNGEPEPRIGCVIADTQYSRKWSIIDCGELKYLDQGFVCEKDVRKI